MERIMSLDRTYVDGLNLDRADEALRGVYRDFRFEPPAEQPRGYQIVASVTVAGHGERSNRVTEEDFAASYDPVFHSVKRELARLNIANVTPRLTRVQKRQQTLVFTFEVR